MVLLAVLGIWVSFKFRARPVWILLADQLLSSPPILPLALWNAHWRAVGPEGALCVLQEDRPVFFHVDISAIEPPRTRCLPAKCIGHLLSYLDSFAWSHMILYD